MLTSLGGYLWGLIHLTMIKANELRKGVLIIDYTGIVREVYGEDIQQQCWHEEGQSGTTEAPLNPIPLTPEWLERMGFQIETIPDSVDEEGEIIKGYTHWTNGKFCFHFSDGRIEGRDHIQYVHLFQSWYFFNTGEELQIKNI